MHVTGRCQSALGLRRTSSPYLMLLNGGRLSLQKDIVHIKARARPDLRRCSGGVLRILSDPPGELSQRPHPAPGVMDPPRVYFSTLRPSAEDDKIEACCNAICLTSGAPLSSAMRRTGKFQRDRYKSEPSLGTGWTAASNEAAHVAGAVFQQPGESKMHYRSRKAFQVPLHTLDTVRQHL